MDFKNKKNTINVSGKGNYVLQGINTDGNGNIVLQDVKSSQITISYNIALNEIEEKIRKVKKLSKAVNSFLLLRKRLEVKEKENKGKQKEKISNILLSEELLFIDKCDKFLDKLTELKENTKIEKKDYIKEINKIATELNSLIDELGYFFSYIVYSSIGANKFADSVVKQIGHRELQNEAKLHLERIIEIEKQIDYDNLFKADFLFLSDKGTQTIIFCKVIEENKQDIVKLFETDKNKQKKTKNVVTRTLFIIILIFAIAFGLIHQKLIPDLTDYKLPLINIPLSIIIWGFIGSFASMNYRFNKKPISDFGDTIKWLITRPMQGVILSSAFYLALISGLFLITDGNTTNRPEVFLFLAFLIGFSDKFVDKVFKILVNKFIDINDKQNDSDENIKKTEERINNIDEKLENIINKINNNK